MTVAARLVLGKLRDNAELDIALVRARELPPAERLRFVVAKYAAIAADTGAVRYLGSRFRYDNRFTPALLPAYLEDIRRLDGHIGFAGASSVVDVGANVGQFGATLARRFPHLAIWSFEPNPIAHKLLAANAAGVAHWRTVPFGIAEADSDEPLWFVEGKSGQGSLHRANAEQGLLATGARSVVVPLRALTVERRAELGIPAEVDLVKVDVEGAEASALLGLAAVHWRYLALETSTQRTGLDLAAAVSLVAEIWGFRPEVAWAADDSSTAAARDVLLRRPLAQTR